MPPRVLRRARLALALLVVLAVAPGAAGARQDAPPPAATPAATAAPSASSGRAPSASSELAPSAPRGQAPTAGDPDPALYWGVRLEVRDVIATKTAGRFSRYRIDAALEPAAPGRPAAVRGTLDLRFVNDTGGPLSEAYLRLYANDPIYAEGGVTVRDLTVGGAPVVPEPGGEATLLRVPLPAALPAGGAVDLAMAFDAVVPVAPEQGYGMFGVDPERGTLALAHWYPMLAGRDAAGWHTAPFSRNGDPIFSSTALYDVRLTAPADLVVATSGVAVDEERVGGTIRRRYVTGPARDFTIAADDDWASAIRIVGGTRITSYYDPADAEGGAIVLDAAARALRVFGRRFGVYPYRELDLVQVQLRGAGGVEFPQLVYMGAGLYTDRDRFRNPRYLEFVTAHEVAHQWWYGLVGNNQYVDAFIDEGLAEYVSTELYFEEVYDPAEGAFQLKLECELWYLSHLFTQGDAVVDQPTDAFPGEGAYGAIVYGKAAVAFDRLRAEIGDDAFFAALRDYSARHRFGIATPADLRAAFERAAGRDLGPFWTSWFERTDGREVYDEADYAALLAELGLR